MKTAEVQMGSGVPISTTYPMETGALAENLPRLINEPRWQREMNRFHGEQIPKQSFQGVISYWEEGLVIGMVSKLSQIHSL